MVSGDMPPPLPVEGPRGPCGPFCMPLRTSIRPMSSLPLPERRSADQFSCPKVPRKYGEITRVKHGAIRLRANDRRSAQAFSVRVRMIVRVADFIAAAGAVRPIFPGPPGFRRVRLVALPARCDLALGQGVVRAAP